jgi:carotenoid cleavage dioxygenase
MWRHNGGFEVDGVMWRWTIDLATGTVEERQLDDRPVEFPRIDDRLAGLPARYGIAVGDGSLLQYDLETGAAQEHHFGDDTNRGEPGEAVFVPADSTVDERAGWYLTYVYDPVRKGSDLVILDASDIIAEPVARVRLPQRVPHGFHGNWVTD